MIKLNCCLAPYMTLIIGFKLSRCRPAALALQGSEGVKCNRFLQYSGLITSERVGGAPPSLFILHW